MWQQMFYPPYGGPQYQPAPQGNSLQELREYLKFMEEQEEKTKKKKDGEKKDPPKKKVTAFEVTMLMLLFSPIIGPLYGSVVISGMKHSIEMLTSLIK